MNQLSIKITISLLLCLSISSLAQISSNAFYTEQTKYEGNSPNDPVFFYSDMSEASLTAPAGLNFQWYKYSTVSSSFELIGGETNSSLNNIDESGYQVEVESTDGSQAKYYCWNFVPAPQIDSIGVPFASCDNIRLTAYTKSKILNYYDHLGDQSSISIDYGYTWNSIPAGDINEVDEYTVMIDAPFEDTEYTVEVGTKFSPSITEGTAEYNFEAIAVDAKFTFKTEEAVSNESPVGSAPMVIRFKGQSTEEEQLSQGNINDWEWTFGEAGKDFVPDPIFTFQEFGEYPVILTVRNTDTGCESSTDPEVFIVNEMVVLAPNAFTPFSSPAQNDEFRVSYRSVKKFNMLIYNRWGRKVYQSDNPEVGWDGKIGNSKAEPGVYFYQIEAEGYNKGENIQLEGAVHLIVN